MRKARKATPRKKTTKKKAVRVGAKAWTAAEVSRLRKLYSTKTTAEIARALSRTHAAVAGKARALGLKKPKTWKPPTARKSETAKRTPSRRTAGSKPPRRR